MFGIFKDENSFKSYEELLEYALEEFKKAGIKGFEIAKNAGFEEGGILEGNIIESELSECHDNLESKFLAIAKAQNFETKKIEELIVFAHKQIREFIFED